MSVRELSRRFDAHLAAEIVVLGDSLGRQHHLTIHVAAHEACPSCGRTLPTTANGVTDTEAAIEEAKKEMEVEEERLRAHAKRRGYKL